MRLKQIASCALVAVSCGQDPPHGQIGAVRSPDRSTLTWSAIPSVYEVSDSAIIQIRNAEDNVELYQVTAVLFGSDDQVYIANGGSSEIIAVDSQGNVRWRVGRRGDGPREFRSLAFLQRWHADSIVAIDGARNMVSLWSSAGNHGRTTPIVRSSPDSTPETSAFWIPGVVIGMVGDDNVVMRGPGRAPAVGEPGLRNVATQVNIIDVETQTRVSQFTVPGPDVYELGEPGPLPSVLAPMAGATALWVGDDLIAHASSKSYRVDIRTPDGSIVESLAIDVPPRAPTTREREAYLANWRPWFPVREQIPFPETVPTYDRLFITVDGSVWARQYHWGDRREEWLLFNSVSRKIRRLRFPARVTIMDARTERAYGVWTDQNDVEHLVFFNLGPQ